MQTSSGSLPKNVNQPWPKFLDRIACAWWDSTGTCPQPQQGAPWGWGRGHRGTKCCSKLSLFISLSWFNGGNMENPQNKPTLILLSGCAAVGGLLQHRQDGADLPPAPVNSSSQDAATELPVRQDSALEHTEAGRKQVLGSPRSVQARWAGSCIPGAQAELGLGTAPLSWRCSDLNTLLSQQQGQVFLCSWP